MSFEVRLLEAMKEMLVGRDLDVERVVRYSDRTVYSGGCSTCAFDYVVVDIDYINSEGLEKTYTYGGDFGELIRDLT